VNIVAFWLTGCNAFGIGDGCLEGNLDLWCTHGNDGPTDRNAECERASGSPTYRCGQYDVVEDVGGYSSTTHFFDAGSGEHVATKYTTDVDIYCGDYSYWYGRRIRCEPECSYDGSHGLPLCSED
jgi:hypothetical protein